MQTKPIQSIRETLNVAFEDLNDKYEDMNFDKLEWNSCHHLNVPHLEIVLHCFPEPLASHTEIYFHGDILYYSQDVVELNMDLMILGNAEDLVLKNRYNQEHGWEEFYFEKSGYRV